MNEELRAKDELVRAAKDLSIQTNAKANIPETVLFDPPLEFTLPNMEIITRLRQVRVGKQLMQPSSELSFEGHTEDGVILQLKRIRFEGSFYHGSHGRKKISAFAKNVHNLSIMRYSPMICRTFGATIINVDEDTTDVWLVGERVESMIGLGQLLHCVGTVSLKSSILILEKMLHGLVDLHGSAYVHQGFFENFLSVHTKTSFSQILAWKIYIFLPTIRELKFQEFWFRVCSRICIQIIQFPRRIILELKLLGGPLNF